MPAAVTARRQLPAILGGVALIVLIMLLPDLAPPSPDASVPVEAYHGRILEIVPADPGSTDAGNAPVDTARVEILEGDLEGEVLTAFMEGPGGSQGIAGYEPGDEVVVTISQADTEAEPYVAVADRWRVVPLQVLLALFAIAVVVVGGWQGVRALVALGLTIAVIMKIILPLILQGVPPLPVAVLGATAITAATILLTEGRSRSSIAAILGTAGALAITGLLAAAATAAAEFTYVSSDLAFVVTEGGVGLDLRGILLAAIILGAVGVLDDVTVTQAVVVDELAARGALRGRALFGSALGIGRSHIGATVNTLFLAYVGASLPLLVILLIGRAPAPLVWNNEAIATEVVRTLAGSLGIVAAVPLTTFVATVLAGWVAAPREGVVAGAPDGGEDAGRVRRPGLLPVVAIGVVIALLLAATALLPGTQQGRAPLPTEPPFAIPGESEDPGASPDGSETPDPGEGSIAGEPVLAERGEAVPVVVDGVDVGTAAVERWAVSNDGGTRTITVEVAYDPVETWPLDPAAWELLTSEGVPVPLVASPELPASIPAGERRTFTLRAETSEDLTDAFIAYVDTVAGELVFLVGLD
ncbi:MAG TPA: YibE/F family protein [Candidatus Limnocylindrales bacterium]|nr:YibE/F family protein [Candidatus Limnocylindrales bacterium]